MNKYEDRFDAGKSLAESLHAYRGRKDVIVLALPRGGVPVAFEVAKALKAPLDLFIVRKLGVPGHVELAMGAISSGSKVLNLDIIKELNVEQEEIDTVIEFETEELERREATYRGNSPAPKLKDKVVILVDDGIATGASMKAAIQAINEQQPKMLIAAVPVADLAIKSSIHTLVDEFICPMVVEHLNAVGAWYDDFSQTTDNDVRQLMAQSNQRSI